MWDFGRVDSIEPEAIGEPGDRRFRVRVVAGSKTASLWMEKEQIAALSLALRRLLEQTKDTGPAGEAAPTSSGEFPAEADVDFKLSRLGIGHDEAATFSCQITREQARVFGDRAEEIVNAGRPVCVLCGGPLDPSGHKCQRRNGHSERFVSLE
jgi:hypothetical protein